MACSKKDEKDDKHIDQDIPELRKIQFTVDKNTVDKLELSKRLNGDPTLTQTFRRAAALQAFVDKMRREGYEMLMSRADEVIKIFIP